MATFNALVGAGCLVASVACTTGASDESELADAVAIGACGSPRIGSPAAGAVVAFGAPITLQATAVCNAASPEFRFRVRSSPTGAWTILPDSVWTPPTTGSWWLSVSVRAQGATAYQGTSSLADPVTVLPLGTDTAPVANADTLITLKNNAGSIDLVANDTDAEDDPLTVVSVSQGAHGAVTLAGSVATYRPSSNFVGSDAFTYVVGDGSAATSGVVSVTVQAITGTCTIAIAPPAPTAAYGDVLELVASAACSEGVPEILWQRHSLNAPTVIAADWGAPATLDDPTTATGAGAIQYTALVRIAGSNTTRATSNTVEIAVADTVGTCTKVKLLAPLAGTTAAPGVPLTVTAAATCPGGVTPELQYRIKLAGTSGWTALGDYTTGSVTWSPASNGTWLVSAVARAQGAHVTYQVASSSVAVVASPPTQTAFDWEVSTDDGSTWSPVTLPNTNFGCDNCTRYYRTFVAGAPSAVSFRWASDNEARMFVNGTVAFDDFYFPGLEMCTMETCCSQCCDTPDNCNGIVDAQAPFLLDAERLSLFVPGSNEIRWQVNQGGGGSGFLTAMTITF